MEIEKSMLMNINEATKVIGVGRNTLLKMVKAKGFPAFQEEENGKYWIIRDELEAFFSKNKGKILN